MVQGMAEPEVFDKVMSLAKRRGLVWPSFDLYGGTAGFFDYGPMGAQIKVNIEDIWRRYYVIGEGFELIQCPHIAPEPVFVASGHLSHFSDLLVECTKCSEPFRADHLIKDKVENADGLPAAEIDALIETHGVKCLVCGGKLSKAVPFNLMFRTNIGPGGKRPGYLRPETAQGMFVNFMTLYRFCREKLPFGVVQIGSVYRNEISPRQGMLRLREFNQAEAEVFIHPDEKTHRNFPAIADDRLHLVPAHSPEGDYTIKEAMKKGLIKSEIVAYYVALTCRYLLDVGLDPQRLRFRQHGDDEMAHYASDCWDAEAQTSFGWVEIVGVADRTNFDLTEHSKHSGQDLQAFIKFDESKVQKVTKIISKPNILGPLFKKDAKAVKEALETLDGEKILKAQKGTKVPIKVKVGGKDLEVPADGYDIIEKEEKVSGSRVTPHVIEPSYGIDRIIYTLIEHAFFETTKENEPYMVLRLRPGVSPIKVGVFPLMAKDGLSELAWDLNEELKAHGLRTYFDESGTVGKRYARMDEIGTPWCVTVDYDSKTDKTATIRDRDSTEQVRVKISEIPDVICALLAGKDFKTFLKK
jgi:glycyl-tRNA synthetase